MKYATHSIAPKWVQDLLIEACLAFGKEDLPEVVWRRSRIHSNTSGYAKPLKNRILLTAGSDHTDAKRAVLHELAHLLVPDCRHSPAYWDKAWELYRWAKLPIRQMRLREGAYMKGATVAYVRSRKAKEA